MKRHPRGEELGLEIRMPMVNIYTDQIARSAYQRYKQALGLAVWEPMSDAQRTAFDYAYTQTGDFNAFLGNLTQGKNLRESYIAARESKTDERTVNP